MANSWNAYTFSSGKSLNRGFADSWRKRLDEEIEKQAEQQIIEQQKQQAEQKKQQDDKPWYQKIGDFAEESNKAFMGGLIEGGAKAVNFVGSGFNGEEADKRTKDFMKSAGLKDEKGLSALEKYQGNIVEDVGKKITGQEVSKDSFMTDEEEDAEVKKNQTDTASVIGRKVGEGQKIATDIATTVLPGVAAEKALRATKAAQGLLSGGKATKIATEAGLSVGGGAAATAAGAIKDPESVSGEQVGQNVAIDATLGAAIPVLGTAWRAVRNAKNSKELESMLGSSESLDLTDEGRKQLESLASSGLSGKKFKAQADAIIQDAATKSDQAVGDVVNDIENPLRDVSTDDLRAQIDEFTAGGGRTGDVQADYKRVQSIKDELSAREKADYFNNGGVTPAEAQKALDDFDAGNMPESVYTEAAPIRSAEDVVNRQDMPVEIRNAAEEVETDREMVRNQLDNLMSPQTKAEELSRIDEQYGMKLRELNQQYGDPLNPGSASSDIRFQTAKKQLDADYEDARAELDMLEANDAEEVAKYQDMLDKLDTREQNLIMDSNDLMRNAPDQFRDVDEAEAAAQRALLEENLAQAKRFGDSKEIVTEAATSPNPAQSLDTPDGKAAVRTDVAESTAHLEGFQNSSRVRQSVLGLMSPSKNLEAMGLRDLADKVMTADAAQQLANKADISTISDIAKRLQGNPKLGDQIVDYLEGNRQTLSAADQETADMVKAFLDDKKAWLKENGFATIEDYFPHMFDKNSEQARRLFKGKTTGDINFNNLKQRKSDSDDYSRDIVDVLSQYAQSFNKKKFLEPALKPLEDLRNYEKVTELEAQWVDDYITQLKNTKVSGAEKGFNNLVDAFLQKSGRTGAVGGNHYRATLGGQRMISAVATMGMNPGTAIRNMTQTVNTIAGIGPKWSTVGLVRGTRALLTGKASPEFKEMAEAGVFSGGVSKNYNADLDEFSGKIPGLKGRANGIANKMMIMVSSTDAFMRSQAYWGAKARALAKGASEADAMKYAREKVIDTQFMTSKVDMPTNLNGPAMRSLTQLATFSAKQAEFLGSLGVKLVKGDNGKYGFSRPEQAMNLIAAAGAAGVATAALEPLIGFNSEEFIPFYPQIAPFIPGADADVSDALYRSPLVTLLAGDGKSKMGLVEALQSGDWSEWGKDNWSALVPAGTQIKKSTEGFNTTTSGESRNDKGNIRYLQDMSLPDQIKASLFGQYATESGRGWIDEGFPTLSEKQTENVDKQPTREQQQKYVDFYQARKKASGRQDAYAAVKKAAESGDINQATRLAEEYNQKVTDAMSEYWEEHQDMPQELQDEMLSSLYINVGRVVENVKDD